MELYTAQMTRSIFAIWIAVGVLFPPEAAWGADTPKPLVLDVHRGFHNELVQMECLVSEESEFFGATLHNGTRWTVRGRAGAITDGVIKIDATFSAKSDSGSYSSTAIQRGLKIDDFGDLLGGSVPFGGITHIWIRRGIDPLPIVRSHLTREGRSFWNAAEYVRWLGPRAKAAVPELVKILTDRTDDPKQRAWNSIRRCAARTLGDIGPAATDAVAPLVKGLQDPNGYVRIDSAIALWKIKKHSRSVPALIAEIDNKSADIRLHAVAGLGDVAGTENAATAIPVLTKSLQDGAHGVRLQACYSLASFGTLPKSALHALVDARSDANEDVQKAAAFALTKVGQ